MHPEEKNQSKTKMKHSGLNSRTLGKKNESHHKGVQEHKTEDCVFYKQHHWETVNSQASTTQMQI